MGPFRSRHDPPCGPFVGFAGARKCVGRVSRAEGSAPSSPLPSHTGHQAGGLFAEIARNAARSETLEEKSSEIRLSQLVGGSSDEHSLQVGVAVTSTVICPWTIVPPPRVGQSEARRLGVAVDGRPLQEALGLNRDGLPATLPSLYRRSLRIDSSTAPTA